MTGWIRKSQGCRYFWVGYCEPALPFFVRQGSGRMTTLTLLRGRLIEKNFLALNQPDLLVTAIASDIPVKPLQREGRPLVMIEQRWLPLRAVMAVHACRGSILRELPAMYVLVAILTLGRSSREVSRDQLGLHIGRLVAIDTGSRPVRAHQGERSF